MSFLSKIIFYFLFLTCLILPFSFQISTIGLVIFVSLTLTYSFQSKALFLNRKWVELMELPLVLFLLPLIGLLHTNYFPETFDLLIKYIPFVLVSLAYYFSDNKIKNLSKNYIRSGLIFGVLGVITYLFVKMALNFYQNNESSLAVLFSHKYTYRNFTKPIDTHTTYLGVLVLMANIFVFKSKFNVFVKIVLLLVNACGLIFINSKIIIFIFALQLLILPFVIRKRILKVVVVLLFCAIGSGAVYLYKNNLKEVYLLQRITKEIVWDFNSSNKGTSVNGKVPDDSRFVRWKAIVDVSKNRFWLGYGSGSEKPMLEVIHKKFNLTESLKRQYNTHNQYIFYFLENGFLGLLFFLAFVFYNLKEALRRRDFTIVFFIMSISIICVVENYVNRTMGVLAISIFLTFLKKSNEKSNVNF